LSQFSLRGRLESFGFALRGVAFVLRSQQNAWIHLSASVAVIGTALYLDLSRADWSWLVLAITGVWCAEIFNTAVEQLADAVDSKPNPSIGRAKDAAAGAVLIAAMGAVAIGLMVLGPPLWKLF
jgi:diacylglycerol kinase (ATP)